MKLALALCAFLGSLATVRALETPRSEPNLSTNSDLLAAFEPERKVYYCCANVGFTCRIPFGDELGAPCHCKDDYGYYDYEGVMCE